MPLGGTREHENGAEMGRGDMLLDARSQVEAGVVL
jgi:hypothetical protein